VNSADGAALGRRSFVARAAASVTWLLPAVVVVAAIVLRVRSLENADVSWLLTLAEKLLDGRRDFIEVNPPGAIFAYIPAVWLARIAGISPEAASDVLVFLLAGVSLGVASLILGPRYADLRSAPVVTAGAVAVLLVLPSYTFAEREHLGVLLILPWAAAVVARGEGRTPDTALLVVAGLACAACVVVKPHFILTIGILSCTLAWRARSVGALFTLENCIAASLLAVYGAVLWTEFPEFFSQTMPLVTAVYVPNRLDLPTMLFAPVSILWVSIIAVVAGAGAWRPSGALVGVLLMMSVVGYLSFLLQGKGWSYQSYPAMSFAFLALVVQLGREHETGPSRGLGTRLLNLLVVLGFFWVSVVWFNVQYPRDTRAIVETIEKIAPRPTIAMIGGDMSVGFPITRLVQGTWGERAVSRWMAANARLIRTKLSADPDLAAAMIRYETLDRAMLRDDVLSKRPDILLVEAKPTQPFDWLAWARADPQLAATLDDYDLVKQIDDVQIWRRGR
jgi:hypothetical protein